MGEEASGCSSWGERGRALRWWAWMEQAADDGSSSTLTVMTGLHMVAFDGSGVALFKKKGF
jgi:hypothetical protein